jgi:hypothetical protein
MRFRQDLVKALKQWRQEGDRLIMCMDANKDINKKSIGKTLTDRDGLIIWWKRLRNSLERK